MRIARVVAIAGMLACSWPGVTWAQTNWPDRAITLVVPFSAGGGIDSSARLQAIALSEVLGQSVIVENVGAAAGTAGSLRVARAAPDGYTMLIGNTGTHSYSQAIYKTPPYDASRDFTPIGIVTASPRILVVRKDLPVSNLRELIAYAKINQDKMQYSSAGVGSATHLPCALFTAAAGLTVTHVPYRGEGQALQDVIAGRIDYMCTTAQSGISQIREGTIKGIAVMASKRLPSLPDLPTTSESGLNDVEATVWNGYFFPRGTPEPIVAKMNEAITKMLDRPNIKTTMSDLGLEIVPPQERTPAYLAQLLPREAARWSKVTEAAGISMDQ